MGTGVPSESFPILEYNTTRGLLKAPQVGRILESLVLFVDRNATSVEEKARLFGAIAEMYVQMRSRTRTSESMYIQAWTYIGTILGRMPEGCPFTEEIQISTEELEPRRLNYPERYRREAQSYGRFILRWIAEIERVDSPGLRELYTAVMGHFLREQIRKWERRNVDDEIINEYIWNLSRGTLRFNPDIKLPRSEYVRKPRKDSRTP